MAVCEERYPKRGARIKMLADEKITVVQSCSCDLDNYLIVLGGAFRYIDLLERVVDLTGLAVHFTDRDCGRHAGKRYGIK